MKTDSILRGSLLARASEQGLPMEGGVSLQKLVRDDVVFRQPRDRDAELRAAIQRIEAAPPRDAKSVREPEIA